MNILLCCIGAKLCRLKKVLANEERERLGGDADRMEFISFGFERIQVLGLRQGREGCKLLD